MPTKKSAAKTDIVSRYLPAKPEKEAGKLIQARIDPAIADGLRSQLKKHDYTLQEWMEGAALAYMEASPLFVLFSKISANVPAIELQESLQRIDDLLVSTKLDSGARTRFMTLPCPHLMGFTPFEVVVLGKEVEVAKYIQTKFKK